MSEQIEDPQTISNEEYTLLIAVAEEARALRTKGVSMNLARATDELELFICRGQLAERMASPKGGAQEEKEIQTLRAAIQGLEQALKPGEQAGHGQADGSHNEGSIEPSKELLDLYSHSRSHGADEDDSTGHRWVERGEMVQKALKDDIYDVLAILAHKARTLGAREAKISDRGAFTEDAYTMFSKVLGLDENKKDLFLKKLHQEILEVVRNTSIGGHWGTLEATPTDGLKITIERRAERAEEPAKRQNFNAYKTGP